SLGSTDPGNWSVKGVERVFRYRRADFGAKSANLPGFVGDHQSTSLSHRLDNRLQIKRGESSGIDYLDLQALANESVGDHERLVDHPTGRHDRDRTTRSNDSRAPDWQRVVVIGHFLPD